MVALLWSLFAVPAVNLAAAGLTTPPSAVQPVGSVSLASVASGAHAYDQEYPSIPTSSAVPRVVAQQSSPARGSSDSFARFGVAAKPGASFIVGENGVVVSTSRARLEESLSGLPSRPTTGAAGREYTLPDGSLVRIMEPSGQAPLRASFTNGESQSGLLRSTRSPRAVVVVAGL